MHQLFQNDTDSLKNSFGDLNVLNLYCFVSKSYSQTSHGLFTDKFFLNPPNINNRC